MNVNRWRPFVKRSAVIALLWAPIAWAEYFEREVAPFEARSYTLAEEVPAGEQQCFAMTTTGWCPADDGPELGESTYSNQQCYGSGPVALSWQQEMSCTDGAELAQIEHFTIYEWVENGEPGPDPDPIVPASPTVALSVLGEILPAPPDPDPPPGGGGSVAWEARETVETFGDSPLTHTLAGVPSVGDEIVVGVNVPGFVDWSGLAVSDNGGNTYSLDYFVDPDSNFHFFRATVESVPTTVSLSFTGDGSTWYGVVLWAPGPLALGQTAFQPSAFSDDQVVDVTTETDNEIAVGMTRRPPPAATGPGVTADGYSGGYGGFFSSDDLGSAGAKSIGIQLSSNQSGAQAAAVTYEIASGGETGSATEGAESDAAFAAVVNQPAAFTAAGASADQFAPIAAVSASLVAAAGASDTQGDTAAALAALSAGGTGDATLDALTSAAAALAAGGAAGEDWVSAVQALAELIAGGEADEAFSAETTEQAARAFPAGAASSAQIQAAADAVVAFVAAAAAGDAMAADPTIPGAASITEGSAAAQQFDVAVHTLADLVAGGSAAAAMAGVANAIGVISGGGAAGDVLAAQATDANARALTAGAGGADVWSVVAAVNASILESVGADAIWTATGAVSAAIAQGAAAGATFTARLAESGYVVVGAIRFLAAVSGRPSLRAAVAGTVKIKPH